MRLIYGILGFFLGIITGIFLAACVWFTGFLLFFSDTPNPTSIISEEYAMRVIAIVAFCMPILLMPIYMTRYFDRCIAAGKDRAYMQKNAIMKAVPLFIIFLVFLWVWSPIFIGR